MGSMAELLVCAGLNRPIARMGAALSLALLWLSLTLLSLNQEPALAQPERNSDFSPLIKNLITVTISSAGQVLDRVQCSGGYTATIYTEVLSSPHGLAFGPDGNLYVSDSTLDQVLQVGGDGTITPVLSSVFNPEGLDFDAQGNLYVVEDRENGRILSRTPTGVVDPVAGGLDAPEDVIWVNEGGPDGMLYVTESNIQQALNTTSTTVSDYQTYLTAVSLTGDKTRVLTTQAVISVTFGPVPSVEAKFWSYSGVARGADGLFYLINEFSGQTIDGNFGGIPYTALSEDAVFTVALTITAVTATAFAGDEDIKAPEGLAFSAGGVFPLYIAEENIGGGMGRLSQVDALGNVTPFCTGFTELEDVIVDQVGNLYVAEDPTGMVIRISDDPPPIEPSPTPTPTPTLEPEPGEEIWLPVILLSS